MKRNDRRYLIHVNGRTYDYYFEHNAYDAWEAVRQEIRWLGGEAWMIDMEAPEEEAVIEYTSNK